MSSYDELIYSLHPLERKVLLHCTYDSVEDIARASKLSEAEVLSGAQMLEQRGLLKLVPHEEVYYLLTELGNKYLREGLPEYRLLAEIGDGKKLSEIKSVGKDEISPALGYLKRNNLILIKSVENDLFLSPTPKSRSFLEKNPLSFLSEGVSGTLTQEQKELISVFKMRGLVKEKTRKKYTVYLNDEGRRLRAQLTGANVDLIDELTEEVLVSRSWKNKKFRYYDIGVKGQIPEVGRRHPMMESNNILRDIFIEMGFQEMKGPLVECAFWNMDVMWIPQDHPARDEQDTFYLEGHAKLDRDLVEKERWMHENGIKRTHTQKGGWSEEVASRRLLRTHSTATTFRTLYFLSEEARRMGKDDIDNGKYFYIAHNFRNEKVDATHLAEFFQAEGFIIGDNLSLADLMGFVKEFYGKLGIHKIMFKPTYNPYTEPSMEAHYYDERMGKWYALINSGIFRPETLLPFGIRKTIIAWGMGASRIATLLTGKVNMREITGATCDFEWLRTRPNLKRSIIG